MVGPAGAEERPCSDFARDLTNRRPGAFPLPENDSRTSTRNARAQIRNEHVGFIFQNFQLLPTLNALENVLVPWS